MAALGIQSCSLKRHIPKGQYLINKVKIKGGPSTYSEDLYNLLREKPNKKILGLFRANMWFYLWSKKPSKAQEQLENGVWEAPVLVDSLKLSTSASQMQDFLFNKGYFHNKVSFNVEKKRINLRSRIRNVSFHITPGERFNINKVGY